MKGRIFSATLLVIVLVTVLAVPASAGKPAPTITVAGWTLEPQNDPTAPLEYFFEAKDVTWKNAPTANELLMAIYVCPAGTAPDSNACVRADYTTYPITRGPSKQSSLWTFYDVRCSGYDYIPAVLLAYWSEAGDEVLASAFSPNKVTGTESGTPECP
jgi:hypothetical protein